MATNSEALFGKNEDLIKQLQKYVPANEIRKYTTPDGVNIFGLLKNNERLKTLASKNKKIYSILNNLASNFMRTPTGKKNFVNRIYNVDPGGFVHYMSRMLRKIKNSPSMGMESVNVYLNAMPTPELRKKVEERLFKPGSQILNEALYPVE